MGSRDVMVGLGVGMGDSRMGFREVSEVLFSGWLVLF